jgi:hypothetical protein
MQSRVVLSSGMFSVVVLALSISNARASDEARYFTPSRYTYSMRARIQPRTYAS